MSYLQLYPSFFRASAIRSLSPQISWDCRLSTPGILLSQMFYNEQLVSPEGALKTKKMALQFQQGKSKQLIAKLFFAHLIDLSLGHSVCNRSIVVTPRTRSMLEHACFALESIPGRRCNCSIQNDTTRHHELQKLIQLLFIM